MPVLLVAGHSEREIPANVAPGLAALRTTLSAWAGVVVSGGTVTGVPGTVGAARGDRLDNELQAVGYVPEGCPERLLDRRYDELRFTPGSGFSLLEPLLAWEELIAAGTAPSVVCLLGIGGGTTSEWEYLAATALGAEVGLVAGSGGAADRVLELAQSLAEPVDPAAIPAFVSRSPPKR